MQGDQVGHFSGVPFRVQTCPIHDERRHTDGRQNLAKVGLDPSAVERVGGGRAGPSSKPIGEPLPLRRVGAERRRGVFENLVAELLRAPPIA